MGEKKQIRRAIILAIIIIRDDMSLDLKELGLEEEKYKEFTRPVTTKEIIEIYRRLEIGDNITTQTLYKLIKDLYKEDLIITVDPDQYNLFKNHIYKTGAKPTFYAVKKSPEHFLRLSKEIYNIHKFKNYIDRGVIFAHFNTSDYAKTLINMDLVNIIEKDLGLSFTKIEKETILKGLRTSIYSFWKVFDYYQVTKKRIEEKGLALKNIEKVYKTPFTKTLSKKVIESEVNKKTIKKTLINKLQLGIGEYIEANDQHLRSHKIMEEVEKEIKEGITTTNEPDSNEFTIVYDVKIRLEPTKTDIKPGEYNISYIDSTGEIRIQSRLIKDYTIGLYIPDPPWK